MPALAWSDFDALPDALLVDRFEILLSPTVSPGLNQTLSIRCTQIAVPAEIIEVVVVAIQGMEFNFRGRRTYDKKIAGSFVEDSQGSVSNGIATWMQSVVGSESQGGATKAAYATQGTLNIFDQSNNVALAYLIDNMWPDEAQAISLDGATSGAFIKQIGFTYDRFNNENIAAG